MGYCGHVIGRPAAGRSTQGPPVARGSGRHIVCLCALCVGCSPGRWRSSTNIAHINVRSRAGELAAMIFFRLSVNTIAQFVYNQSGFENGLSSGVCLVSSISVAHVARSDLGNGKMRICGCAVGTVHITVSLMTSYNKG